MKKTLQECKEIVAKDNGYSEWNHLYLYFKMSEDIATYETLSDLANKMYYEQSEWISVDDELPDHYINVLIWNGGRDESEAYKGYLTDTDRWYSMSGTQLFSVTHWMNLPKSPEK